MKLDQQIALYIHEHVHIHFISQWLSSIITPQAHLIFWFFLTLYTLFKGTKPQLKNTIYFFFSLLILMFITGVLKIAIGRARPNVFIETGFFGCSFFNGYQNAFRSFPSSHAATAFALIYLWIALKKPFHKWFFYLIGTILVSSRLFLNQHYVSDVLAGSIIGIISAKISLFCSKQIEQVIHLLDSLFKKS